MNGYYDIVRRRADGAIDRLRTLLSGTSSTGQGPLPEFDLYDEAPAMSSMVENLLRAFVVGSSDKQAHLVDLLLARVMNLVRNANHKTPLLLPGFETDLLKSSPDPLGTLPSVGRMNQAIISLFGGGLRERAQPAVQEAFSILMSTFAANGYLSLREDVTSELLRNGDAPLVAPRYLREAIACNNAHFAAALIDAGADWRLVPDRDNQQGLGVTDGAGDANDPGRFDKFVFLCIESEWGVEMIYEAIRARRALDMCTKIDAHSLHAAHSTPSSETQPLAAPRRRPGV